MLPLSYDRRRKDFHHASSLAGAEIRGGTVSSFGCIMLGFHEPGGGEKVTVSDQ